MTLAGRTVFITGTNRGLGKSFVETFAASGANVIAHAEVVAFLASDAASFVNGQIISVDGGRA